YQQFTDKKLEEIMFDMELKFSRGELSIEAFAKLRQYLMSILEKITIKLHQQMAILAIVILVVIVT
ncbi:hypothetical protein, partial [Emiliania huxleyi virus 18]